MHADVIIIGAGASGLMAAHKLSVANKKVLILEAKNRIGGRIHTLADTHFTGTAEAGAEFIHGKLPTTFNLIKEAGLQATKTEGQWLIFENGKWQQSLSIIDHEKEIIEKLKKLSTDMTLDAFFANYLADKKYAHATDSLKRYVQGYDAGDVKKISAHSFLQEWEEEDEEQFRIDGGYGKLMDWLAKKITEKKNQIVLSTPVTAIHWKKDKVEITTTTNETFIAAKAIITVPLGVLQLAENETGSIRFDPSLPQKMNAAKQMGFSGVIKILMQFKNDFREKKIDDHPKSFFIKDMGFTITDAFYPTWWTQLPERNNLFTGWLAGPPAVQAMHSTNDELLEKALDALQYIFNIKKNELRNFLVHHSIHNWTNEPYTRGAYSYTTLQTKEAINEMMKPEAETLFFAGEALHEDTVTGTVEAALISGQKAAEEVLKSIN
jgi:monoamine oxidase